MLDLLVEAAKVAIPREGKTNEHDLRLFWIGALGMRKDGSIVKKRNIPLRLSGFAAHERNPFSHAEGRVIKAFRTSRIESTLYVARVLRESYNIGHTTYGMSRPCSHCQNVIRSAGIKRVFYTVSNFQYGVLYIDKDLDVIYDC